MKNKNILFLCQYFYPEKISSGVLPFELATSLSKEGYNVNALVGYPKEYSDKNKVELNETIKGVNIKRVKYIQSSRSNFIGRIMNYIGFFISIAIHPLKFKANDIFICYTNPPLLPFIAALYNRLFKKQMILIVYDLYPDVAVKLGMLNNKSIIVKLFNRINNFVYKNINTIVVLSSEMKKYLIEIKHLDSSKIRVIPNWYMDLKPNLEYSESDKKNIKVFYGGNMGLAQNIEIILETAKILKNEKGIEFYFVGHGIKKDKIAQQKEKENLENVYIYNFLPKDEYDKLVQTADIVIVSLEKKVKGLGSPSKVYSYLSAGKPIIAIMPEETDVVNDIIRWKNGIVITDENCEKLSKELLKLKGNQKLLLEMGKNSRILFEEKYTLDICKKQYLNILK